jgi:hypothetical protein
MKPLHLLAAILAVLLFGWLVAEWTYATPRLYPDRAVCCPY